MLAKRLLKLNRPGYNILKRLIADNTNRNESSQYGHSVQSSRPIRGIDIIRETEEVETNFFPSISMLGVTTDSKVHKFEANCDHVIKYIKMGAINKNIASQYCHYLAHLARNCDASELDYYAKRSIDLLSYLMRNNKDLTPSALINLICDISDTTASNCSILCDRIIEQEQFRSHLVSKNFTKILACCYKFGLWESANAILSKFSIAEIVVPRLLDQLITALPNSVELYKNLDQDLEDKKKFRDNLIEHLYKVCEGSQRDRVQFITKHAPEFVKSISELGVKVVINPAIKMSGRCTNCNSYLPVYDPGSTAGINKSIKKMLHKRLVDKYYLHSSPKDLDRFEEFLHELYRIDRRPIDLVIDGLNIAFKNTLGIYYIRKSVQFDMEISEKRQNTSSQAQVLINTIIRGNILSSFRKILVIGRDHMKNWPGLLDFFHKQRIHHYFSFNHSNDDLFQLYAATLNPKTFLITSDFYRDHLALLDHDERLALERWIDTHQVWIQAKTLKPIWPTPYEKIPSTQRATDHFHVPLIDFHKLELIANHEPPPHLNNKMTTWACCKVEP